MGQIASSIGSAGSSLGSAMTNANTFAPDPSGFNGSEWAARFMGGAAKGAGQGLQNQQQQKPQGQPAMPVPMAQQPQVNLPTSGVQGPQMMDPKRQNSMFFGQ